MCQKELKTDSSSRLDTDLQLVRASMQDCLSGTFIHEFKDLLDPLIGGGKMLRSRLILSVGAVSGTTPAHLIRAGAAVEMLHAASLLHDDIVDGGTRRRGKPALWVSEGTRAAVLLGDLLVSLAVEIIQETLPSHLSIVVSTLREMCDAEVEQEFADADVCPSWDQCVSIARRKTGSLFGFAAACAGGSRADLVQALRRAGYALGTAYQLADDVLDTCPDPLLTDKSLGTDAATGKLTAATVFPASGLDPMTHIKALLRESEDELSAWPVTQQAWRAYVDDVVTPVVTRFVNSTEMEMRA